jgi:aryl-alcohol dehydrogenase-like predicted oxidoreductase
MNYRSLGATSLKISPLTLGTMMFGGDTNEEDAHRIIDSARELGINSIDTADVYNGGKSEEVVGRAIGQDRDKWVLASKFASSRGKGPNEGGLSRKYIIQAVEASLTRLGTDYLDIAYMHRDFPDASLAEAVRAVADLVQAGKIRYFGVSNFAGWRIAEVCSLCDQLNIDRPAASQPLYNLVNREAEVEQLLSANHFGVGVISYSPLARGVLTGKYVPDAAPPADSRAGRNDRRMQQTEWRAESLAAALKIKEHADTLGITAADFSLAWVLNNRLITSAIVGPRTMDQWKAYLRALDVEIGSADEALVDELVAPGHHSTHGFTDSLYPIRGRVPR